MRDFIVFVRRSACSIRSFRPNESGVASFETMLPALRRRARRRFDTEVQIRPIEGLLAELLPERVHSLFVRVSGRRSCSSRYGNETAGKMQFANEGLGSLSQDGEQIAGIVDFEDE